MSVAIIGCGYVFDKYMSTWAKHTGLTIAGVADIDGGRVDAVTRHYGLKAYADNAALLADPEIDIVANLTSITAHYEVTKAALEAGKHVYSEKPLVTQMDQARELFALAESRGLRLSCAPSIVLGATSQTMWKAVADGAVGDVRLVYAEFDTSPLYLMSSDKPRPSTTGASFPFLHENYNVSASGAPFPWLHEFEMGCTYEHVGYQLSWMCAIFGPVKSVTAFSKQIMPDKTDRPLDPPDTPDFSVATLDFHSGVVGRVTCSVSGANDTRMRIIGNRGMLHAHTYGDYQCPVYLEPFTKLSIKARYVKSLETNTLLHWLFGVGGRRLPLVKTAPPGSDQIIKYSAPWWDVRAGLGPLKERILGLQDKCIGIAELADSIATGRPHFPSHAFTLHLTELTLAIQGAGTRSQTHVMDTTFDPLDVPERTRRTGIDYNDYLKPRLRGRIIEGILDRMKIWN